MARARNNKPQVPFPSKLMLNQWLLGLFGVKNFEQLAEHLRDEKLEGLDENNVHRFHHALCLHVPEDQRPDLPDALLQEYDQNIVKHTQTLNNRRNTHGEESIVWKYFQYLALLFTEVDLDWYFRKPDELRQALNEQIAKYNDDKEPADQIGQLDETVPAWTQLNKLSFWMATGSGKTLLMHANILQYQFYLEKHGRRNELNRIILLTPNEGLSRQHLREFETADIEAELFDKHATADMFRKQPVEILEVTRLRDEAGEKTVAVEAFEGNNLVLVDEGHRGASGGEEGAWMKARNALCEKGFSFEYSATFQQAVSGNRRLIDLYAKSILFNYSYRYFYADGFGKDYQILNLDEGTQREHFELYLVACLLTFFQQQRLYRDQEPTFRRFNIEKPLWIFVGGSVTATLAKKDASDIVEILTFLNRYVSDRAGSVDRIDRVLKHGLITSQKKNLFAGRFTYLNTLGFSSEQIFNETLAILFNAQGGGQLYVENLKGVTGEIALRLGAENEPFGVINVGDDAKLVKLCEEAGLATGEREFSGSLFHDINKPHSTVNVLIGSKKFTEGWSSWRVSTMGLMNVGKSEGAQIIQLFGRGVRLKGYQMSLKRSGKAPLPDGVDRPKYIGTLETLGIFGIHADYMAQFREFLKEEGMPENNDRLEFVLPVIKNLGQQTLRTIRLKKTINGVSTEFGDAFRKLGPIPTLQRPPEYLQKNQVVLNWYPKIEAMKSRGVAGGDVVATPNTTHLTTGHVAFLNLDRLYFELERFKAERGWSNLNLTRSGIADLLKDKSWYRLLIPAEEMMFDRYDKVAVWEEIALALLKKYTERYYTYGKREWELPHLEYQNLSENDPNLLGQGETPGDPYYRILIDRSQTEIVAKLEELKAIIENGELKPWEFQGIKAIWFGRHLYQPLLYLQDKVVEIAPVPLNKGERQFVEDLKTFHDNNGGFFQGKDLYLLRNLSKGRGVGFFEAGNFYPDFILWLLVGGIQHIIFVDPKGIRNIGPTDPKIQFHETIKEIETRLGDAAVRLHSFIVSNTPSHDMSRLWSMDKQAMGERHILFQEEDKDVYVQRLFERVLSPAAARVTS
ncbi:type III restriction protein res subunit [Isosphaera pallida ATCC 43644]|uniref:Type III restriction protein res subunit n=1 Tax=Isosphaera pallida (strain ATCC 43644 / DSM 9630 / IS1B) TaxID=575540 RepID=E8R6N4_ISOPI|nr:DEAD/DEAH box helicase family protein [Isosphaera pallida]ADV63936.1 type III restriction protein res subunit [Isosphaera pallida ATCC 43644]